MSFSLSQGTTVSVQLKDLKVYRNLFIYIYFFNREEKSWESVESRMAYGLLGSFECGKPITVLLLRLQIISTSGLWLNYSKTSLNRPTMGPTLNGPFMEVVGLGR